MTIPAKILIVDDTPTGLEALEDLLAPMGHQLFLAHDGAAALATAVAHTPDLILLDVMMPGMDGFEVCRRLRAEATTAEIPVVMITALNDPKSRLKGIEAGADDFLSKPIDRYELRARVKMIVRLNRYRRLMVERQKFEHVVTYAATGYLILNEQGKILFANPHAQRNLGQKFEEGEQRPFLEWVATSHRPEPAAAWNNFPEPPAANAPRYLVRPESEMLQGQWLQVNVLPYQDGVVNHFLVTVQDVTRQMEEVRDMRNFHRMIHHKLRTPLVGLVSTLEIIGKWSKNLTPIQFAELMEIAQLSVDRLHGQIEDILQYTHLPILSSAPAHFPLTNLSQLIERIALDLSIDTVFLTQSEDVTDCLITPSAKMMELMLYELLENAYKFHPEQMPVVEVELRRRGEMVQVAVSDNGRSLPQPELEQVWTPYYQVEKSFTGEIPGMGLGLPIVASLIWQANGKCRLYNRPDRPGVTVELLLPIAANPGKAAMNPAATGTHPIRSGRSPATTRVL